MARNKDRVDPAAQLGGRERELFERLRPGERRLALWRHQRACARYPGDLDRQQAALLAAVGKGRPTFGQQLLALLATRLAPRLLHRWEARGDNSYLAQVARLARYREAGGDLLELAGTSPNVIEYVRGRRTD